MSICSIIKCFGIAKLTKCVGLSKSNAPKGEKSRKKAMKKGEIMFKTPKIWLSQPHAAKISGKIFIIAE